MFDEDDAYFTGPALTSEMVQGAEAFLGVRLPASYLELLGERNGGVPKLRCVMTPFATSWAQDHIKIDAILGIGGDSGIDSTGGLGSPDLIREWGYPDIGVVVCDTPSAGHDTVMLDYRSSGPRGEPAVAYIDEDRVPRLIAPTFAEFLTALTDCPPPQL